MTRISWLLLLSLFSFFSLQAQIDEALRQRLAEKAATECLLIFREQADLSACPKSFSKEQKTRWVFERLQKSAAQTQRRISIELQRLGVDFQAFYLINALRIPEVDDRLAEWLAAQPEVAALTINPVLSFSPPKIMDQSLHLREDPEIGWGVDRMNAPAVWALGFRGQAVVVGGQDTGYEWDHPALKKSYRGYQNGQVDHNYHWHDAIHEDLHPDDQANPCGYDSPTPCGDNPHGNLTIAVAVGETPHHKVGMAPNAKWIGCRNMDRGFGSPATYLECFEWFLAPTDTLGQNPDPNRAPHVINNSWKCPEAEGCTPANFHLLQLAVDHLRTAGVVVVASAGNDGPDCNSIDAPPAMFASSFTVGASNIDDQVGSFSSRGPVQADSSGRLKPDVLAPGVDIPTFGFDDNLISASGTSLAGPHVAGLVALIISARPSLAGRVDRIEEIIRQSALPRQSEQECDSNFETALPNPVYGHGIAQALTAIELALQEEAPPAAGPLLELRPNPAGNQLIVRVQANSPAELEIFSLQGQLLLHESRPTEPPSLHRLNVRHLPPGIYLCRVRVNGQTAVKKFVKW